jgi:ABC-2 type transport system ATP-binding protein
VTGDGSAPALSVKDLVKTYGRNRALDGVSFTLERGSFTALLGPNGAGKTTLMQILTGLFAADAGEVAVEGRSVRDDPAGALAPLGIVFQQASLDLDLSSLQNLRYYAGLHGLTGARAREAITAALGLFGLEAQAREKVRRLSGGTRRKLELGRALMTRPSVLLLDEATAGLDPASRADLVAHVRDLTYSRGLAVLWATHIVSEIEKADRIIVLHRGRILADGLPAEIIARSGRDTLEQAFLGLTRASAEAGA